MSTFTDARAAAARKDAAALDAAERRGVAMFADLHRRAEHRDVVDAIADLDPDALRLIVLALLANVVRAEWDEQERAKRTRVQRKHRRR